MGFESDKVGRILRKNRGTEREGYAHFPGVTFRSAKHAMRVRVWNHELFLRLAFPWAFDEEMSPELRRAMNAVSSLPGRKPESVFK